MHSRLAVSKAYVDTQLYTNSPFQVNGHWEMSGPLTVLVDMYSATQGSLRERGEGYVEAINRNHSELVKFRRNDEDYERVLSLLKRMTHRAMVEIPKRCGND